MKSNTRFFNVFIPVIAIAFAWGNGAVDAHASLIVSDNFDSGNLGNWTAGSGGNNHYTFSSGIDFSTSGPSAAELFNSGGAGTITLTDALSLDTEGYTSVKVAFDWSFQNGSSTRRAALQYAADGTNFSTILQFNTGFSAPTPTFGSSSFTLNEGPFTFTDTAKFRFSFSSNQSSHRVYIDNIVITGLPDFVQANVVPEPATATLALLGLGGLMMRRRRMA